MGKRTTTSTIKANKIKGNGNQITIHATPPMDHVPIFDILQSKEAEIREQDNIIAMLRERVEMQTQELDRLRSHITQKDNYINRLLFKQAS